LEQELIKEKASKRADLIVVNPKFENDSAPFKIAEFYKELRDNDLINLLDYFDLKNT